MKGAKMAYRKNTEKMTKRKFDFIKDFISVHNHQVIESDRDFEIKMTKAIISKVKHDIEDEK